MPAIPGKKLYTVTVTHVEVGANVAVDPHINTTLFWSKEGALTEAQTAVDHFSTVEVGVTPKVEPWGPDGAECELLPENTVASTEIHYPSKRAYYIEVIEHDAPIGSLHADAEKAQS